MQYISVHVLITDTMRFHTKEKNKQNFLKQPTKIITALYGIKTEESTIIHCHAHNMPVHKIKQHVSDIIGSIFSKIPTIEIT